MADALPTIDREFLSVLVRGAQKTFENAEQLYFEAEILAKAGATARAFCLHQISLEECSKLETMGAWATSMLAGLEVDRSKVLSAFRRHSSKNKNNAYMMPGSRAEEDAKKIGDWKTATEEFEKFQADFHDASNEAKNASLYVDWKDGEFASPAEQITPAMLAEIVERNGEFLGYAQRSLKMMQRLDKSPDGVQDLIVRFVAEAEKMRAGNMENPAAALNDLIRQFLDAGSQRAKNKSP